MVKHEPPHDPLIDALVALGEDDEEPGDGLMLEGLRRGLGLTDAPLRVGRFVLREPLGSGAMGVVYAADDPHLERRVALKLLAPAQSEDPMRGLAEARALARLSHPNVVAVHEAGLHEGRVYLVMELVEGLNLRQWLRERRSWREVCEVMLAAGRGLAAAHAVGIVHCDFKPDNVLVGDRVRVADFGLARANLRVPSTDADAGRLDVEDRRGTLAFMAPEQLRDGVADARSDQFSLCATMFLALTKEAPFSGSTARERCDSIARGLPRASPSGVPRWLRAMLVRGLQHAPERRYPRLDDLLDELERRLRPRRWVRIGLATTVVATAGVVGWWSAADEESQCRPLAATIDEVWNPQRRDAIATAFEAVERPYASHAAAFVASAAERHAAAWSDTRVDACRARQQGRRTSAVVQCLEDRRAELDALLTELESADEKIVEHAAKSISALASPYACTHASEGGDDRAALDGPAQARLDAARGELAHAWALEQVGRYARGRDVVMEAVEDLRTLPAPSTLAAALMGQGRIETQTGELDQAHEHLQESLNLALRTRSDALAARAAMVMCDELTQRGELVRAHEAADLAAALHQRVYGDVGWPQLAAVVGGLLVREERDLEAVEAMTAGIAAARPDEPADAPFVMAMYLSKSNALVRLGRLDEAEEALGQAQALGRRLLGEDHPLQAVMLISVAAVLHARGETERALDEQRRAVRIWQRSVAGPTPVGASMIYNVGNYTLALGRPQAALASMVEALEQWQRVLPPKHPRLALAHTGIGRALRDLGRLDEALDHHLMALEILREQIEAGEPQSGFCLLEAAKTALEIGDTERANTWIEQGLAAYTDAPNPLMEGGFRFQRARSLARTGALDAALAMGHDALADLRDVDEPAAREVEAWLADLEQRTPSSDAGGRGPVPSEVRTPGP